MTFDMPVLSPPRAPYAYQPAEATYALPDVEGIWTVKRLSTNELVVTVNDPGDARLAAWSHEVVFYFDAAGVITSAHGYAPTRGGRGNGVKHAKFPRKKLLQPLFDTAAAMRQRLLDEPVRDLPVLAEFESDSGLHRLVVLTRDAEEDYEVINVNADQPTDCVVWHGSTLADVLSSALPGRSDLTATFYDQRALEVHIAEVVEPRRKARESAEAAAAACADVGALPEAERDLLCAFLDFQQCKVSLEAILSSYTSRGVQLPPEVLLQAAEALQARGWLTLQVSHDIGLDGITKARLTDHGHAVAVALARFEQKRRQRDPFNLPCRCTGGDLTPEDRQLIFPPREPRPLVVQTRPMFGGPRALYESWLAALPPDRRDIAANYRATVLDMVAAYPLPELKKSGKPDKLTQTFHALQDEWNALRRVDTGRIQAGFYATELAHSKDAAVTEDGLAVCGNALMGLEADLPDSADSGAALRSLLRLYDGRRRPGCGAPTRPTDRQRAALDWPAQALEAFPRWLAWFGQPPASQPLDTPNAIARAAGPWAEWEGRNLALAAVVSFLETSGVQTPDGQAFDVRAWLKDLGWARTAASVQDTAEAAGVLAAVLELPLDDRPAFPALSAGERRLYGVMAGHALGQALHLDSAAYWDQFQMCAFDGADHFELAPADTWGFGDTPQRDPRIAKPDDNPEADSASLSEADPSVSDSRPVASDGPVIVLADWKAVAEGKPAPAESPSAPAPVLTAPLLLVTRPAEPLALPPAPAGPALSAPVTPPLPQPMPAVSPAPAAPKPTRTACRTKPAPAPSPVAPAAGPDQTCTLTCNGLGRLKLENGQHASSISWIGALTFVGEETTVEAVKHRFGQDLRKRRPGKRWSVTR